MAKARKPAPKKKAKRGTHKTLKPAISQKEMDFCAQVFEGKSNYEAYVAVYGTHAARHSTDTAAWRLLKKREIRQYIRELQDYAAQKAKVRAERLVAEMLNFATGDLRELFVPNSLTLRAPSEWPAHLGRLVEFGATLDPDTGELSISRVNGPPVSVRVTATKALMEVLRMVGADAESPKGEQKPLVVRGADPDVL